MPSERLLMGLSNHRVGSRPWWLFQQPLGKYEPERNLRRGLRCGVGDGLRFGGHAIGWQHATPKSRYFHGVLTPGK
jgi:hypothetical protein